MFLMQAGDFLSSLVEFRQETIQILPLQPQTLNL